MTATTLPPRSARAGALTTIRRGLRLSPELRRGLPGTLALAVVATAGRVIIPVAIQQVIDRGITSSGMDMGFVMQMCALALGAVLVTAGATGWMHLRLAKVSETALSGLRVRAFRHIHDLSMLHQAAEQRGALVSRVTSDVDEISRFMQWAGLQLITNGGQALLALVVMFVYSVPLGAVVAASLPLIAVVMRWFQRRLDAAYLRAGEGGAPPRRAGRGGGGGAGDQGVRDRGPSETAARRGDRRAPGRRNPHRRPLFVVLGCGRGPVGSGAGGGGGRRDAPGGAGSSTVGEVIAFMVLVQLFIQPIQILGEAVNEAQTAVAGWRRVLDVLDLEPDVADPGPDGVDLPNWPLGATFESVTFRYPRAGESAAEATGPAALIDVSVRIEPKQKVAVVGETGSGKTTFAKLLTRLMDPTEGVVRIGDVDVSTVRFRSLRDRVVMVPQEGMLFSGSVADNVRMGRPDATDDEIEETFRELGLDGWLEELPLGLHTPVGERGSALSVGERQLVTLARAAIADPDLLVLDEATSAVDPVTEQRINRALEGLASGRTVVTIAHRLSTAEQADRVLVFDQGRIVQDGPHAQLLAEGGVYGRLYESWRRGTSADRRGP